MLVCVGSSFFILITYLQVNTFQNASFVCHFIKEFERKFYMTVLLFRKIVKRRDCLKIINRLGPWVWRSRLFIVLNYFELPKVERLSIFLKHEILEPNFHVQSTSFWRVLPHRPQIRHIHFIMLKENYPFLVNKKTSLKVRAVDNRHSTPSCLL